MNGTIPEEGETPSPGLVDRTVDRNGAHGKAPANTPGAWCVTGCVVLFAVVYVLLTPLSSGFEFGGDEAIEFQKALLLLRNPSGVAMCWNDQPWFSSWVLAWIWKWFGLSLSIPRLLALGIFISLLFGLRRFQRLGSTLGWAVSLTMLTTWKTVLTLSTAWMCEVPAFSLTCMGAACVARSPGLLLLVTGGALAGLGCAIKLTAGMALPATLALLWFSPGSGGRLKALSLFCGSAALVVAAAFAVSPNMDLAVFMQSHLLSQNAPAVVHDQRLAFSALALLMFPAALLCLPRLLSNVHKSAGSCLPTIIFPVVLLATALVVHTVHRPWWDYYWIHFAVPLAILTGLGVSSLASEVRTTMAEAGALAAVPAVSRLLLIASAMVGFQACHFWDELGIVQGRVRADEVPILQSVQRYADRTRWLFAGNPAFAFHARLQMPPELTVLPLKRIWSGSIDQKGIIEIVRRYQPEQVLLRRDALGAGSGWIPFVERDYVLVAHDAIYCHFVARTLNPAPLSSQSVLQRMGL